MQLAEQLKKQGGWLFRWRSYFRILFALPIAVAFGGAKPTESSPSPWSLSCLAISLVGMATRGLTVGQVLSKTSGRNTRNQIADQLNVAGMYSLVRHPLYLGHFVAGLGVCLVPCHAWLVTTDALAFWVYYERICWAEEVFLEQKFGPAFVAWAEVTPAFLPPSVESASLSAPFLLADRPEA